MHGLHLLALQACNNEKLYCFVVVFALIQTVVTFNGA